MQLMKILNKVVWPAVVMMSFAFTGASAAGPQEDGGKRTIRPEYSEKAADRTEQRPVRQRDDARDQARMMKQEAAKDFQHAVRKAERTFREDEKAASGLQGDERRAAMQRASDKMKASIKEAEEKRDAVLKDIEPRRGRTEKPEILPQEEIKRGKSRGDEKRSERAKEQQKRREEMQMERQQSRPGQ